LWEELSCWRVCRDGRREGRRKMGVVGMEGRELGWRKRGRDTGRGILESTFMECR